MKKKPKTVTLSVDVIMWVEEQIQKRKFSSFSHACEYALYEFMKKEKKEKG